MFKHIIAVSIMFLLTAIPTHAGTINGAYVGCLSKAELNEFVSAAVNKDNRQMQALLGRSCFAINGREFSIVDRGFINSKIRVYVGNDSVVLWTVSEATR